MPFLKFLKSTRLSFYCTDNTVVVALVTNGSTNTCAATRSCAVGVLRDDSWVRFFSYVSDLFISYV